MKILSFGVFPSFFVELDALEGEVDFFLGELTVLTHGVQADYKLHFLRLERFILKWGPLSLLRDELFIVL